MPAIIAKQLNSWVVWLEDVAVLPEVNIDSKLLS